MSVVTNKPRFIEIDGSHYNLNLLVRYKYNRRTKQLILEFAIEGNNCCTVNDPDEKWYRKLIDETH